MSPLTTHVLDTSTGRPAAGVPVVLERQAGAEWRKVSERRTDADGRVKDLLSEGKLAFGVYRLVFRTAEYFKQGFYPEVSVVFNVNDERHHHVPLLISPFGYSTYRGS